MKDLLYQSAYINPEGAKIINPQQFINLVSQTTPADFDGDNDVDLLDFGSFANQWMNTGCGACSGVDLTGDGNVDLSDLQRFAENWLAD